jgi:hypothetical protein
MKRIVLTLTLLLGTSSVASAQFAPGKEVLRGLAGVHLIVMFDGPTRAEAFDEVKRPGLLKMLEDDTKAKLEKAGILFSRSKFADNKDYARLIVLAKLDNHPNGFETEVKLLQRVRLTRDPSLELDAVTWSRAGIGNKLEIPIVRSQIAGEIDRFIEDYLSANPKQSAAAARKKSK